MAIQTLLMLFGAVLIAAGLVAGVITLLYAKREDVLAVKKELDGLPRIERIEKMKEEEMNRERRVLPWQGAPAPVAGSMEPQQGGPVPAGGPAGVAPAGGAVVRGDAPTEESGGSGNVPAVDLQPVFLGDLPTAYSPQAAAELSSVTPGDFPTQAMQQGCEDPTTEGSAAAAAHVAAVGAPAGGAPAGEFRITRRLVALGSENVLAE